MLEPLAVGEFPRTRLRRNRRDIWSRRLVAENQLTASDLIWPVFVAEGEGSDAEIPSMPGVVRYSIESLIDAAGEARDLGVPAIALFPKVDPALKTPDAREATNPDNLVCRAVRAVKAAIPDIGIVCDVALDPFNSDGHDGLVINGYVDNDRSVEVLIKQALVQAQAGCDVVAPSDMMDGRIGAIRKALDDAGLIQTRIMSYAASMLRPSMVRSAMLSERQEPSPEATRKPIKWIPPIATKLCAKLPWISAKVPIW